MKQTTFTKKHLKKKRLTKSRGSNLKHPIKYTNSIYNPLISLSNLISRSFLFFLPLLQVVTLDSNFALILRIQLSSAPIKIKQVNIETPSKNEKMKVSLFLKFESRHHYISLGLTHTHPFCSTCPFSCL